jgi:hypothetical protein
MPQGSRIEKAKSGEENLVPIRSRGVARENEPTEEGKHLGFEPEKARTP